MLHTLILIQSKLKKVWKKSDCLIVVISMSANGQQTVGGH